MNRRKLLEQVGVRVFRWELLSKTPTEDDEKAGKRPAVTGSLPNPPDALWEALEGRRGPIFWPCGNPNEKPLFFVAERGHAKPYLWDPLANADQLRRVVEEAESTAGTLSFDDGLAPGEICEAVLKALEELPRQDVLP